MGPNLMKHKTPSYQCYFQTQLKVLVLASKGQLDLGIK